MILTTALLTILSTDIAPESLGVPNRQPQLAASGKLVVLTYGVGQSIQARISRDGGETFTPYHSPIPLHGKMPLGARRGPRVAVVPELPSTTVVAAVVGAKGGGADGDVMAWLLGKGPMRTMLNQVPGSAREGLHAIAANEKGLMVAAWLDLRKKGTRIYGAISRNGGRNWEPDRMWYESPSGSVCECCHLNLAVSKSGEIFLMFRNSIDGARDMYLSRSKNGVQWETQKIGQGTWILKACPMDGGDLKLNAKGEPLVAWRRDKQIYFGGLDGKPETLVGEGKNAVVVPGAKPVVIWQSAEGLRAGSEILDPKGAFASTALLSDGSTLVAWESANGSIKTKRIR